MEFPNIDPVAIDLGFFQIRWYALAYLGGFLGGWFTAVRLAKLYPKGTRPNANDFENLVTWVVLGVVLGGRLGYVLFYNPSYYIDNPSHILQVWRGGMSFHGGLIGVMTAVISYALIQKISLLKTGDVVAAVVPIGLGLGRLSNFINGELYGRPTDMPWGIVFPHADAQPRHPSQLYEAFLEGLVLFILLNVMMRNEKIRSRPGIVMGTFGVFYGASRILIEFFREPDAHIGYFLGFISMGQILSLPLIIIGSGLIIYALKNGKKS